MTMTNDLALGTVENAYAYWAPIYDALCGPFFLTGRRAAAAAARRSGRAILEIGVGTGLSFDDYGPENEITGLDGSAPMIAKALKRVESGAHSHVKDVKLMDAHNLDFPDASFDCVVAQFVITLVAEPERVLSECARVVKPGGEIILVNHFYSEKGLSAAIERWSARYVKSAGLRPDFRFDRLMDWAQAQGDIDLVERKVIEPLRFFTLARFRRRAERNIERAA
jgi:phosphatidylethanolamine/phosphatidyl-N-methylethanolamine N-methyltransferase